MQHAGLGSRVEAARESRRLHRAEGFLVRAVAHRDGPREPRRSRGARPSKETQVFRGDGRHAGAEADDGFGPGAAGRERGEAGLGEVEEAGDEQPLRAVLPGERIEAARPQLERDARARALDARAGTRPSDPRDAVQRGVASVSSSRRLPPRPASRRLSGLSGAGERRRGHGPVRGDSAAPVDVLEPVEVRRPVAQARVEVASSACRRARSRARGSGLGCQPLPGPVHRQAAVEMEAEVVQLRARLPLHQHRRVEARRPGMTPGAPRSCALYSSAPLSHAAPAGRACPSMSRGGHERAQIDPGVDRGPRLLRWRSPAGKLVKLTVAPAPPPPVPALCELADASDETLPRLDSVDVGPAVRGVDVGEVEVVRRTRPAS